MIVLNKIAIKDLLCPECNSSRVWKDGLRKDNGSIKQRYICRACGYRFSQNDKYTDGLTFQRQVSVSDRESKNLAEVEPQIKGLRETTIDINGKFIEFLMYLKKQGYAETTQRSYGLILKSLVKHKVDITNPEDVKQFIAKQECGSGRKWNIAKTYTLFLKMQGMMWQKPRYKPIEKFHFIPIENEIDALIGSCSKQVSCFLQVGKETAARRGEIYNLTWTDLDFVTKTIRITPEKGSKPRIFRMTDKLTTMIGRLKKTQNRIWSYTGTHNLDRSFRRQRKRAAYKLGNPRLEQITFHTLRRWKASIEYAKCKDSYYVQEFLGHKDSRSTERYIQRLRNPNDENFICKTAKTDEDAKELIENGFEYILTTPNQLMLFKKLKVNFLGGSLENV